MDVQRQDLDPTVYKVRIRICDAGAKYKDVNTMNRRNTGYRSFNVDFFLNSLAVAISRFVRPYVRQNS